MSCDRGCCPTNRDHWLSIAVAPSATPSRHPQAVEVNEREKRWQKDMPAYKAIRKNGLQPKQIDGCAELQTRATTQQEIELGSIMTPSEMQSAKEGRERYNELFEGSDV